MATEFVALVIALTLLFIASLVGKPLEKKSVVSSEKPTSANPQRENETDSPSFGSFHTQLYCNLTYSNKTKHS